MSERPRRVRDALIVAGGRGTRLQPLTHDVPKPLLPFCGAPFLEGLIRRLAAAGMRRVFLVVGADTAPFGWLRPAAGRHGVALEMVSEPEPLDTAGGVRSVVDGFDRAVLVLNGDIATDLNYAEVVSAHLDAGADATMVLTEVLDTSAYGVAVRETEIGRPGSGRRPDRGGPEASRIVRFVEKPAVGSMSGHGTVNAGTYVLEPHVLTHHPQGPLSFERVVFPSLLDRGGRLEGFVWKGAWIDLGTPERYREGHAAALSGALSWPTLEAVPEVADGVRIAAGAVVERGAEIIPPVLVLGGARVAAGASVGPATVIGHDADVGPGAALAGAVLHDGVRVGRGVAAPALLAGYGARIEAGAQLGPGVVLGSFGVVTVGEQLAAGERRPPPRD